jgi:hypothetical protein
LGALRVSLTLAEDGQRLIMHTAVGR